MKITAWFIVEYQGFLGLIQVVPWQINKIFTIKYPRFREDSIPRATKDCNKGFSLQRNCHHI